MFGFQRNVQVVATTAAPVSAKPNRVRRQELLRLFRKATEREIVAYAQKTAPVYPDTFNPVVIPQDVFQTGPDRFIDVWRIGFHRDNRGVNQTWSFNLMNKVSTDQGFEAIWVSQREDGTMVVLDGQHRLVAFRLAGKKKILCKVFRGLTYEQERTIIENKNNHKTFPVDHLVEINVGPVGIFCRDALEAGGILSHALGKKKLRYSVLVTGIYGAISGIGTAVAGRKTQLAMEYLNQRLCDPVARQTAEKYCEMLSQVLVGTNYSRAAVVALAVLFYESGGKLPTDYLKFRRLNWDQMEYDCNMKVARGVYSKRNGYAIYDAWVAALKPMYR